MVVVTFETCAYALTFCNWFVLFFVVGRFGKALYLKMMHRCEVHGYGHLFIKLIGDATPITSV
jgi:hypothetical protein